MAVSIHQRWLALILVVGLVARILVIEHRLSRPLQGDELSYDSIASNLAAGHGYSTGSTTTGFRPTALRGPGYVIFLAAFDRLFGHRPLPPLVAQALLDTCSAWLVARLARRWFRDQRIALVAAALYAAYPPFLLDSALVMTETTSQFMVIACVDLFFAHLESRRLAPLLWSSAAIGWCALSKPQLALVAPVLALMSYGRVHWREAARTAAIQVVVIGLVLAPWIVRNAVVFRAFVPGVSIGGVALWLGAGPYGGEPLGGVDSPAVPAPVRSMLGTMTEMEENRWATQEARRVIAAHPLRYLWFMIPKTARLWFNLSYGANAPSRASWLLSGFNAAMIALAVVAARVGHPLPAATAVMIGLAVFWTLVHAPFFTVVRYAFPYYALLFVFSAAGIVALARGRPDG